MNISNYRLAVDAGLARCQNRIELWHGFVVFFACLCLTAICAAVFTVLTPLAVITAPLMVLLMLFSARVAEDWRECLRQWEIMRDHAKDDTDDC